MATKTLIIYPNSDVSLSHKCSTGSSGYALINEETADDDTSYIYQEYSTSSANVTSKFKCYDNTVTNKIYLRGVSSVVRSRHYSNTSGTGSISITSAVTPRLSINGNTEATGTSYATKTSYANSTSSYSSITGLDTIYNSITDANFVLSILSSGKYSTSGNVKSASANVRVTQAYLTITYSDVWDCVVYSVPGTGIASVSVSDSEVIDENTTTFTATLEDNYIFDGWYSDAECTNKVSSSLSYTTTITTNTTLYAKGFLEYSVTVYGDDNSTAVSSVSKAVEGTNVTVTATVTSDNYKFKGWYSNSGRTTLVSSDNPYTFTLSSDTILYASTCLNEVMFVKVDGEWKQCSKVYKKIDGNWVEQTSLSGLFSTDKKYKIIKI